MDNINKIKKYKDNWLRRISPSLRSNWVSNEKTIRCTNNGKVSDSYTMPLRIIYDHEVLMFRNCELTIVIEDVEYRCLEDTFIIIPPGKWHYMFNPGKKEGRQYWCHFDWTHRGTLNQSPVMCFAPAKPDYKSCRLTPDFIPDKIFCGKIPNPEKCYAIAERMADLMAGDSIHNHMIAATALWELLIELLDSPRDNSIQPKGEMTLASQIRTVLDNLALNMSDKLITQVLLSKFNYSYEHLCRDFKKTYSIPPMQYLQSQRIIQAKVLLKNTNLDIAEIAFRTGFNSPSYFTKTFRISTGLTPSKFRKTNKNIVFVKSKKS